MPRNRSLPQKPFCAFSLLWAGLALFHLSFPSQQFVFLLKLDLGKGRVLRDTADHGYRTLARLSLLLLSFHLHIFPPYSQSMRSTQTHQLAEWLLLIGNQSQLSHLCSWPQHRPQTHSYIDCTGTKDDAPLMHLMPDACSESCHSSVCTTLEM